MGWFSQILVIAVFVGCLATNILFFSEVRQAMLGDVADSPTASIAEAGFESLPLPKPAEPEPEMTQQKEVSPLSPIPSSAISSSPIPESSPPMTDLLPEPPKQESAVPKQKGGKRQKEQREEQKAEKSEEKPILPVQAMVAPHAAVSQPKVANEFTPPAFQAPAPTSPAPFSPVLPPLAEIPQKKETAQPPSVPLPMNRIIWEDANTVLEQPIRHN